MNVRLLVTKVIQTLQQDGLQATLKRTYSSLRGKRQKDDFDAINGTDTGGRELLWRFQISSSNGRFGGSYEATEERELVEAVSSLNENPEAFSFIDLGCGKGRTLLVAANLGFRRVIGVEFARELVEIAKKNLEKKGIGNVEVHHSDAAEYSFPKGDLVVYLFNPFSKEVMESVVERLRESQANKLYVVYKVPKCAELFDSSKFLTRFGCPTNRPYIQIWKGTRSS